MKCIRWHVGTQRSAKQVEGETKVEVELNCKETFFSSLLAPDYSVRHEGAKDQRMRDPPE